MEESSVGDSQLLKSKSWFQWCRGKEDYQQIEDEDKIPNSQILSPEIQASFISRWFYFWFNPIIEVGRDKPFESEDLYRLDSIHDPKVHFDNLNRNWINSGAPGNRSLTKAILKSFWRDYLYALIPRLFQIVTTFLNPMFVGLLISFIENPNGKSVGIGVLYVCVLLVSTVLGSIWLNINWFYTVYMTRHIRSALLMIIYSKILRLSAPAKQSQSSGKIINLMSNDITKLEDTGLNSHFVYVAPISLIVCFGLVTNVLGIKAALAGHAVLFLLMPLSYFIGRRIHSIRNAKMKITDERIKASTELFQVIKTLKFYALEKIFGEVNQEAREDEVKVIRKYLIYLGIQKCVNFALVPLMSMVTFITYILVGGTLTPTVAFSTITLYNVLRWPFNLFNVVLTSMIEAKVSIDRLQAFLELDEVNMTLGSRQNELVQLENSNLDDIPLVSDSYEEEMVVMSSNSSKTTEPGIYIEDASFSWTGDIHNPTLHNIDFVCKKPELICIVGSVGSGKSSLVNSIINEIPLVKGQAYTKGTIGYCSQSPFLIHGTVRDNILFEKPFHEERYNKVIRICKLEQDLDMLISGDMTLIGERGINLSGGQKARIGLARAVYSDADIMVLDDPLSAVDAQVSRHLFEICIRKYLKNKVTVFITHQLQYISQADRIVFMEEGRIVTQGTYSELMKSGFHIVEVLSNLNTEENENLVSEYQPNNDVIADKKKNTDQSSNTLKKEEREEGSVTLSVYKFFFKEALFLWILYLGFVIGHRAIDLWLQFYLAHWSQQQIPGSSSGGDLLQRVKIDPMYTQFIYTFVGITIAISIVLLIREVVLSIVSTITGNGLFKKMMAKLMKGTMAFFDTTPKGRIITRISSDIDAIDTQMAHYFSLCSEAFFQIIAALITVIVSVKWWALMFIPLPFFYAWTYKTFVKVYRDLARLFSITKAPIFSQINETISGVQTIRAYQLTEQFEHKMEHNIDENQRPYVYMYIGARWLSIRNDMIATVIIGIVGFTAIIGRNTISPGLVGIGLTYSLLATELISGFVRSISDIESRMSSVERIKQYTQIDIERPDSIEAHKPPSNWPSEGIVEFNDVCLRYRPGLPLVLNRVTFSTQPMEKIGIVGRTGSGKSTLLSALFSFTDLENGSIIIDGVDINKIGVHDLRKQIAIIPQDPVIFEGTIRRNLDPISERTEDELWEVLQRVHLSRYVRSLPDKLDTILIEEGSNFSLGQRQLLCVGRALLRNCKVLVLDEASSSIDLETDSLLQETIKNEFKSCTILSIAHRIQTIINYDRILVMSDGKVVEFGEPKTLFQNGGVFSSMCKDAKIKM